MPRISFASITAKLWRLFLHPKSTLIREYSPRGNSQKPWVIQTCLHHPYTFLREKCGLGQLLPKWSRCPGYSNYTGDTHQEAGHVTFHRWLVFLVSAALSQSKSRRTQCSSIWKSTSQNSNFTLIKIVSILCLILWTCPHLSHIHPKELPPRFVRPNLILCRV